MAASVGMRAVLIEADALCAKLQHISTAVLVQLAVAIVLGAENLSEVEQLQLHHRPLFGFAASDFTARRVLAALDEATLASPITPATAGCASTPPSRGLRTWAQRSIADRRRPQYLTMWTSDRRAKTRCS